MKPFAYTRPATIGEAVAALQEDHAHVLGGGTDLLPLMRRGIAVPGRLVSLKAVPELGRVAAEPDGGLAIGAAARLAEVAAHPEVAGRYPVLQQALAQTATPQVRHAATLGGCLCQRPRCWYFRHPDFSCLRRGGAGCCAVAGQSRYHAVLGGHDCFIVQSSDAATALVALDARIEVAGPAGRRTVAAAAFFVGPSVSLERETTLAPGELVTQVRLAPPPAEGRGLYLKASERRAADFALASVAVALVASEGEVKDARIALGGVAPVPWRATGAEEALRTAGLTAEGIRRACEAAVDGARPLPHNEYKVALIRGLLRKGLLRLAQGEAR